MKKKLLEKRNCQHQQVNGADFGYNVKKQVEEENYDESKVSFIGEAVEQTATEVWGWFKVCWSTTDIG